MGFGYPVVELTDDAPGLSKSQIDKDKNSVEVMRQATTLKQSFSSQKLTGPKKPQMSTPTKKERAGREDLSPRHLKIYENITHLVSDIAKM